MTSGFRKLTVYKKAFDLAMEIFIVTKRFPVEEKYALTDRIRSKMSDVDMENTETQVSLDFALACQSISNEAYQNLRNKSEANGRMLHHMIENPEKYMPKTKISDYPQTNTSNPE